MGRRHEHHGECIVFGNLEHRRCGAHQKSDRPQACPGKRKHDHGTLAESFPELKHVSHPLECVIDTSHQWYAFEQVLYPFHESLADEASSQHPRPQNEEEQERNPRSRNFKRHHGAQQVHPQAIQRHEQGGENQEGSPSGYDDK